MDPILQAGSSLGIALFYLVASFFLCALAVLGIVHLGRPRATRATKVPRPHDEASLKASLERNELY